MFLEPLLDRNPAFVEAAMALHRDGHVPANSYVLDLDTVEDNARTLRGEADRLGLTVLAMTKQVGRNPAFLDALKAAGIDQCVAVDLAGARAVHRGGARVGHVGHLVQIPTAAADEVAALEPTWWTVFSDDKAREAADAASRQHREQALLARIHAEGDTFYRGHEGGFSAEDVVAVARRLDALDGGRFAGITSFPALLIDHARREVVPTPNLATLERARTVLEQAGWDQIEVNAPGTTSTAVLRPAR